MSKPDFAQSFDARDWAKAFVAHVQASPSLATDEETLVGWFANAIMRGYDEHARQYPTTELVNAVAAFDAVRPVARDQRHRDAVMVAALALARPHIDHDSLESRPRGVGMVTRPMSEPVSVRQWFRQMRAADFARELHRDWWVDIREWTFFDTLDLVARVTRGTYPKPRRLVGQIFGMPVDSIHGIDWGEKPSFTVPFQPLAPLGLPESSGIYGAVVLRGDPTFVTSCCPRCAGPRWAIRVEGGPFNVSTAYAEAVRRRDEGWTRHSPNVWVCDRCRTADSMMGIPRQVRRHESPPEAECE